MVGVQKYGYPQLELKDCKISYGQTLAASEH